MNSTARKSVIWMTVVVALLAATVVAETLYISDLEKKPAEQGSPALTIQSPQTTTGNAANSAPRATLPDNDWLQENEKLFDMNPYQAMQRIQQRMDRMFNDSFLQMGAEGLSPEPVLENGKAVPATELTDQGDHYTVRMDLPGAQKSKINVKIEDNQLTVTATREQTRETKNDKGRVILNERGESAFARTLALPTPVKDTGVTAHYKDGVLTVQIPKVQPAKAGGTHEIEVR